MSRNSNHNSNNTDNDEIKIILLDSPKASGMLYYDATKEDLSLGGQTGLFRKALRDTSKRINVATLRGIGLWEDSVWNKIINSCIDLTSSYAQEVQCQLQQNDIAYSIPIRLCFFLSTIITNSNKQ
jgi:hypothetical protein